MKILISAIRNIVLLTSMLAIGCISDELGDEAAVTSLISKVRNIVEIKEPATANLIADNEPELQVYKISSKYYDYKVIWTMSNGDRVIALGRGDIFMPKEEDVDVEIVKKIF
jgi:hypothetical protein